MATSSKKGHRPDYFLLALIAALLVFGIVMLASASSDLGQTQFNDSYYYLKHQLIFGLLPGLAGFFLGYTINYQRLKKFAFPLLLLSIAALALVFTPFGVAANGASRWLRLGPVSFQPAELLKFSFIFYLAAWLSNVKIDRAKNLSEGFLPFLLICGFIGVLLVLQPATSTVAILLLTALVVYFLSGAKIKYVLAAALLGVAGLAAIIYITPYRRARITGFLNVGQNTEGQNYHINQALIAIGSGGLWGVGYGQSATKASYLPAPIDDSIFAIVSEELGFVGAGILAAAFGIFAFRTLWLAKKMRDQFGKLLLVGFGVIIALQAYVNMAAISGLLPLTGVPLPFMSYGGTALAVFLTMSGVIMNVSKYS